MPAAQTAMEKKKRSFAMPHVFVILTIIMLLVWAISFFVPSGNFERVLDPNSGREIVNPDVFNFVEKEYIMPDTFFQTFYNGIVGGISFVLYGMISAIGVRNVVENKVDFTNSRNLIIAAVILVCALGFDSVGGITFTVAGMAVNLSGLAIAAIAGILLNAILPGNDYEFDEGTNDGEGASLRV